MFSRLSQSLAFHTSPESFIASRLQKVSIDKDNHAVRAIGKPEHQASHIVQASILDRDVHIITSYALCRAVLEHDSQTTGPNVAENDHANRLILCPPDVRQVFTVGPAYMQLMTDFFPAPNILLEDGAVHGRHKDEWAFQIKDVSTQSDQIIRKLARRLLDTKLKPAGRKFEVYDVLKVFSWDVLFGIFLGLDLEEDPELFSAFELHQENLLRGQFSLFPVSVATPLWASARSRGLKAVSTLEKLLETHVHRLKGQAKCPFLDSQGVIDNVDMASHLLLFTSSIANKALSSLLTAFILNLFIWKNAGQSLASMLRKQNSEAQNIMLRSILLETERLCPPVVGVMRRVAKDIALSTPSTKVSKDGESVSHIVGGHDTWLYFSAANRDETIFENPQRFVWDRFINEEESKNPGLGFGLGAKICLGKDIIRRVCMTLASELLDSDIDIIGAVNAHGVQSWLGWSDTSDIEMLAKDLKQLPCQRPRKSIILASQSIEATAR